MSASTDSSFAANQARPGDRPAYLDCAASVPMRPAAIEAMQPFLHSQFANPSGAHKMARNSRRAIDNAREIAAEALGVGPHDIVFTSGGTEADNLAVRGVTAEVSARSGTQTVAVCPATEHHAVLEPVLAGGGRTVAVQPNGRVDLDDLAAQLQPEAGPPVSLVSVMLSNNETGVIADLDAVADVVDQHAPQARLHTDAVQGINWTDVASATARADLVSLSAHKFGGPKGVGLLAARPSAGDLVAQLLGGGQEADRRSGTHNTAGIVAMGAALAELGQNRNTEIHQIRTQRDRLAQGLATQVPGCRLSVDTAAQPPAGLAADQLSAGMCQVLIEGVQTEALLVLLDRCEVMASAAASCSSGAMEPSHVLSAMGFSPAAAAGSLRLSLGWCTQPWEIDQALSAIPESVKQIRD